MEKKIIEWLNKTGYPLELYAESILTKFGYITSSSSLYTDVENGTIRELDLESEKSWSSTDGKVTLLVNLLIECKKSEKPFVLLSNENHKIEGLSTIAYSRLDHPNYMLSVGNPNQKLKLPLKTCNGFKLLQSFANSDETIHKAANTIIKSFIDFTNKEVESIEHYKQNNLNSITIPLLLIDAPLFELQLNDKSEMDLTKVESGILNQKTHLRDPYSREFPILIIKKESFGKLLENIDDFALKNFKFLVNNPANNVINFEKAEMVLVKAEK